MTIEQATEIAKRHGFEVKDGKVLIPWTNFSIKKNRATLTGPRG